MPTWYPLIIHDSHQIIIPFKSLSSNVNKYGGFKVVIQKNHDKNLHIFGIINNYSPKARWLSGNIHRDEVEVNIPRKSPSLRWIIVLVFLQKLF